jgi:hypothetical protein
MMSQRGDHKGRPYGDVWSPHRAGTKGGAMEAERKLIAGASLLAGLVCAVPLSAAMLHPPAALSLTIVLLLVAVSAARPLAGLVALSLLFPLTVAIVGLAGGALGGSEFSDALLFAFVAGATVRLAIPARDDRDRLGGPALVLIAALVTSAAIEFQALQAVVPQRNLVLDLWRHLTRAYWIEPREFLVVHDTLRWIAGLMLAVYAERAVGRVSGRVDRVGLVFRVWLLGGVAGAMLAAARLAEIVLSSGLTPRAALAWVAADVRLSVLHPDLNAAGSYFALFIVPAVIVGWRRRAWWMLGLALPMLVLAFGLARSRAAIAAVVLVLCAHWSMGLARSAAVRWVVGVLVVVLGVTGAVALSTSRAHVGLEAAVQVRVQMTQVSLRTIQRYPVFGVGLGDYIRMSRRFITRDMVVLRTFAPGGENAHDNYLQIAAELGIPAALVFLYLVGSTARLGWIGARGTPEGEGLALGVTAFLLSALFGHPLLVPEVLAVFFLALGLAAGFAPAPAHREAAIRPWIVAGATAFYVISLAWRLH